MQKKKKQKRARPKSPTAELTNNMLEEGTKELGGLKDIHIKMLSYFLRYEYKIPSFQLVIDYESKKKKIFIITFDEQNKEFFLKPKDPTLTKRLKEKLGLKEYTINFVQPDDYLSEDVLKELKNEKN